jgi:hypothetical protein
MAKPCDIRSIIGIIQYMARGFHHATSGCHQVLLYRLCVT